VCLFKSVILYGFAVLLSAVCLAAALRSATAELRWDSAKVSVTVTFQDIDFAMAQVLQSLRLGIFAIASDEACWFLHIWDLCPFNGPP